MKKLTFAALGAVFTASLFSCGGSAPKADLKNEIDTVSYAIGLAQTQGLKSYLVRGMGVDTAYMDEFYRGLNAGVNAGDDKKKAAYYAGVQIGQQISNQMLKGINHQLFGNDSTKTISMRNFMAGFYTGAQEKEGIFTIEQAQQLLNVKMPAIKAKALEEQYGENKKAGEKYLAEYAKKEGVKELGDGVLYSVIKEGNGPIPSDTSTVVLHYEGKTIDGKVFDSSYERKQPSKMRANQVVSGFSKAITHMPVGSTWEVVIPQDQAYGERETSTIEPFSTLIFKIELIEIASKK